VFFFRGRFCDRKVVSGVEDCAQIWYNIRPLKLEVDRAYEFESKYSHAQVGDGLFG
jgi:hypothetical protein